jgi:hypothetical protein
MRLPGVGPSVARDLLEIGVRSVKGLARRSPERMYEDLERLRGVRQDTCVLYVFRCAVYAAREPNPDPSLLQWWKWKDAGVKSRKPTRETGPARAQ